MMTSLCNYDDVVDSSKDTTVKLWDLDTYHCFQTLVECHSEVCEWCVNARIFLLCRTSLMWTPLGLH